MRANLFRIAACIAGLVIAAAGLWGDPVADAWARIYRQATSVVQRYEIMQNIVEMHSADYVPLLSDALQEVLGVEEPESRVERATADKLARMIVRELGELKAQETAPLVFQVVKEKQDPLLRAEAILALGKMRAYEYTGQIALILRNLTLYRGNTIPGEETIVYACVSALGWLKRPEGYEPVFFAAHAGYSERITQMAEQALQEMVDDPSDILERIVRDNSDYTVKLQALREELGSGAPEAARHRLAVAALEQGLSNRPHDRTEAEALRRLRMEATAAIASLQAGDEDAAAAGVRAVGQVLALDTDVNELLQAITALQSAGGEGAVAVLAAYLKRFNDRQESGLTVKGNEIRLVIATIQALGELGGKAALPELLRAQYMDSYSGSIIREAKAAAAALR